MDDARILICLSFIIYEADFMQTKSYCEAILKQKRHNDVEDIKTNRCKISLFSQDNFQVLYYFVATEQ